MSGREKDASEKDRRYRRDPPFDLAELARKHGLSEELVEQIYRELARQPPYHVTPDELAHTLVEAAAARRRPAPAKAPLTTRYGGRARGSRRPAPGRRALTDRLALAGPPEPTRRARELVEEAQLHINGSARVLELLEAAVRRRDATAAERAWSDLRWNLGIAASCLDEAAATARDSPEAHAIATMLAQARSRCAEAGTHGAALFGRLDVARAEREAAWRRDAEPVAQQLGVQPIIRADAEARERTETRGARGLATPEAIYLHPTRVAPGTAEGRAVLTHELYHVAQAKLLPQWNAAPTADRAAAEAEAAAAANAGTRHLSPPRFAIDLQARAAADSDASGPTEAPDLAQEERVLATPLPATLGVQFHGLSFTPIKGAKWVPGIDKAIQGMAIIVKALVGGRYSPALAREALGFLRASKGGLQVTANLDGPAGQADEVVQFTVELGHSLALLTWLRDDKKLPVTIGKERIDKLLLGVDVETAWSIVRRAQPPLPPWYSEKLFSSQILAEQYQALLLDFRAKVAAFRAAKDVATADAVDRALNALVAVLRPDAELLDRVRADASLTDHGIYRGLWQMPAVDPARPRVPPVAAETAVQVGMAALFFQQARTDRAAAARALEHGPAGSKARRTLLDGMLGVAQELGVEEAATGDAELRDAASRANAPPVPSSLAAYPALPPPFAKPARTSHVFTMRLDYANPLEAVGAHFSNHYTWEVLRVPDEDWSKVAATAEDADAKGHRSRWTDVAAQGAARHWSYLDADREKVQAALAGLEAKLGPITTGAESLAAANRALAVVGQVVRTFIRRIAEPANQETIPFDRPGLYVVRCKVNGRASDQAQFIRATSVAWHPVFVRPPQALAEMGLEAELQARASLEGRLREVESELAAGGESSAADRAILAEERKSLRIALHGSVETILLGEQQALEKRRRKLADQRRTADGRRAQGVEYELEQIDRRVAEISEILDIRHARHVRHRAGFDGPTRIPAVFVGDEGKTLSLVLEAIEKSKRDGELVYHVTDATTRDSGQATGDPRASRDDAIADAIKRLLEKSRGYGRGYATIHIPAPSGATAASSEASTGGKPATKTIRIEADLPAIAMEAIDNVTTTLSLAAIAAAPFTGGASLVLLLPINAVGAIPSAYRLADRASAGTLRLDLAAAMDIVDIVGSAAGIGQIAASSLRHVSLSDGLLMIGLGSDGLGAALASAAFLEAAKNIDPNAPPGVRRAMLMELIANQLLGAGIHAGTALARRAQILRTQAQHSIAGASDDAAPPGGAPGLAKVDPAKSRDAKREAARATEGDAGLEHASPQDKKLLESVLALDPNTGRRLIREYGDELTDYLRTNPLTTLAELEGSLIKGRKEVKTRVRGLAEGIDIDKPPDGWRFETGTKTDGVTKVVRTRVYGPNGAEGYFERAYNPVTGELQLRMAFLKESGKDKALPNMIPKQLAATEMVPGRGTPTVQYITLYQMKKLGVPMGDEAGRRSAGVQTIHMSDIQYIETIVHLHWLRKNRDGDLSDLIQFTASVKYAETTAVQSGYERSGPPLLTGGQESSIRELLEFQENGNAKRIAENDKILTKYGFDRDTVMRWGFDIDLPVRPKL